jgi:hypothetical protein
MGLEGQEVMLVLRKKSIACNSIKHVNQFQNMVLVGLIYLD